jgi:uncharacterized membrane protein YvlD (DUF360 family)
LVIALLHVGGRSVLGLRHGPVRSIFFLLTWPLGASLFGFFALIVHLIQPSLMGATAAGLTWNLAVLKIKQQVTKASAIEEEEEEEDASEGDER